MCAKDAENSRCVSNDGESAQHTSPLTTSESAKTCRLRCNPQRLPEPTLSQPALPDMQTASDDTKYAVRDFFADLVLKSKKKARERGWR